MTKEAVVKRFKIITDYFADDCYYEKKDFEKKDKELYKFFIHELKYWISCCYESGHALNDELLSKSKTVRNYIARAKRLIASLNKELKND